MNKNLETEIIIEQRLKKIDEAVSELKKYQKLTKKEFLADKKTQYAAMFGLIVGIEAICDIGNHILARYFNRAVETYKDIILSLGECYVISSPLAKKSVKMADFRNILIHLYTKIEPEKVYENLQKAPEEFREFCQSFLKFINKK